MNEDFYINLIYKKLSGELTPPEAKQLNAWIAQSDDNRLTATSVEKAWQASDNLQPKVEVDLDTEFASLENLLDDEPAVTSKKEATIKPIKTPTQKAAPRRNWLSIAAGLLLLIGAGFLLRNSLSSGGTVTNKPLEWVTINTADEGQMVNLSDDSKVYLNKHSKLDYPNKFAGNQRLVKLKGEAFFEVSHDAQNPFIVQTDYEQITVLGTSFNVNTNPQSRTVVYVATGKVELKQTNTDRKTILKKGDRGQSSTQTGQVENLGQQLPNDMAWRTQKLEFVDTPMLEVLTQITKMYDVKISIGNPDLKKCTFTSTFENQKIETVLETLKTVLDIKVDQKSDVNYTLEGGSCD